MLVNDKFGFNWQKIKYLVLHGPQLAIFLCRSPVAVFKLVCLLTLEYGTDFIQNDV